MAEAYDWIDFDPTNALPPGVDSVITAIEGALVTVKVALEAVKTTFTLLKTFIIDGLDPLKAVLETIRADLAAIIESMEESGVYLLTSVPQSLATAKSPRTWVNEVVTSMTDRGDPNRPDFAETQDFGGAILMVTAPDFNDLLSQTKPLVEGLFRKFRARDAELPLKNNPNPPGPFVLDEAALREAYDAQINDITRISGVPNVGDELVGQTSGATARVLEVVEPNLAQSVIGSLIVSVTSFNTFDDGEVYHTTEGSLVGTIGTFVAGNETRGAGRGPDWEPPALLIDVIPPLGILANILKKALGFLVFGQGLSALIQQFIDFLQVKIDALDALVIQLQEVVAIFENLLTIGAVNVLFFEGTALTTADLQANILASGLPPGFEDLSVVEAPQGDGTVIEFQLAPADNTVAAGAVLLVASGPTGEIANTVALLKGLLGAA